MSESAKICAYVSTSCHYEKKDVDTRKGGKKSNPIKQSFAQLSKNSDWLEKVTEKKDTRNGNIDVAIVIPTQNRELDWGAGENSNKFRSNSLKD